MNLSQSPRQVRGRTAAVTIGSAAALMVAMAGPVSAHGSGHGHGRGFDPTSITGLASPLGFDIGSDGTVYVAEGFTGQVRSFGKRGKETILVPSVPGQFTSGVAATGRGDVVYTLSSARVPGRTPGGHHAQQGESQREVHGTRVAIRV